jgi:hypothetical protein
VVVVTFCVVVVTYGVVVVAYGVVVVTCGVVVVEHGLHLSLLSRQPEQHFSSLLLDSPFGMHGFAVVVVGHGPHVYTPWGFSQYPWKQWYFSSLLTGVPSSMQCCGVVVVPCGVVVVPCGVVVVPGQMHLPLVQQPQLHS